MSISLDFDSALLCMRQGRPESRKDFFPEHQSAYFSGRVCSDAILPSALSRSDVISLGASWAFSLQPVWLPDCRSARDRTASSSTPLDAGTRN